MRFPVLFVTHGGGPMPLLGRQPGIIDGLQWAVSMVPEQPKAIVLVTAHWETKIVQVNANNAPTLEFDYYGFPPESYKIEYKAPGNPELASQISNLLAKSNIEHKVDKNRKWDHGVFVPLKVLYPSAKIPVVSVSVTQEQDSMKHIQLGEALAPLRDQGVLIVCSGASFHNFHVPSPGTKQYDMVVESESQFINWITKTFQENPNPFKEYANWRKQPFSYLCHPDGAAEHFMPFFVAAGAAGVDNLMTVREGKKTFEGAHFVWQHQNNNQC